MGTITDTRGNTRSRIAPPVVIIALAVLAALPLILSIASSQRALVRETGGAFYLVRSCTIAGKHLLCLRTAESFTSKKAALESPDAGLRPALISMETVAFIEILHEAPPEPEAESGLVPAAYLGTYRINASGNPGYLFLGAKEGYVYGSLRFPEWGRGVAEPLKGVYIRGNTIRFTRSITTPAERERTGATTYFTQVYTGEYRDGGRTIQGRYMVGGSPRMWDARKAR
ncbi:MAG TPA: hypothetical protein VLM75_03815 [Spirochaetota bacterium]|nr:hypothetical protein [Spirochaetota bacterium]